MDERAVLKRELMALGAATEAGFDAGGEDVERIKTLAAALEAVNPTPEPARAAGLLGGRWRLLYSSFGLQRETTLARLAFNRLPKTPITVTELFQEVDAASGLYDNVVDFGSASGAGRAVVLGRFEPVDVKRLDVEFFGARVDPVRGSTVEAALAEGLGDKLPPMHSDVTYLDEDFRLNRGGFGNLYVLALDERSPKSWSRDA